MNQMMERKRLRREYLRRKATSYAFIGSGIGGATVLPFLAIYLFVIAITNLCGYTMVNDTEFLRAGIFYACLSVTSIFIAKYCVRIQEHGKRLSCLSYIPPVTLDTLPTEEILVRAADVPPVAQSEVLLRAAQVGQETPKEELLRVAEK